MSSWPEYQSELETLAAQGLSAALIAGILGVTRNAVIGRANRTGVKINQDKVPPKGTPSHYPCGHPRTKANSYYLYLKWPSCKTCQDARTRKSRAKRAA